MNFLKNTFFISFVLFSVVCAQPFYETFFPKTNIVAITTDGPSLWFATYGQGIFQYNPVKKEWTIFSSQNNSVENDFYYCIAASKDFVWAGSSDGLYTFDRKKNTWRKRKFAAGGEYGNWIRALYYDEKTGFLWIGRFKNLTRFDIHNQKYEDYDLTIKNDDRTNNFKVIKPDGDRYLWIGTEAGVFRYDKTIDIGDKSSLEYLGSKDNGFRGESDYASLHDILVEKDNVWFGLDEFITDDKPQFNLGGLYKFNRRASWARYDQRNGLSGNGIRAIVKTGNLLWIAVYQFEQSAKNEIGKGLDMYNKSTGKIVPVNLNEIKTSSLNVQSLFYEGTNLWIGTDDGLWKIKFSNAFAEFNKKKKK